MPSKRRNNCKPARGTSTSRMTKKAWKALDDLPHVLRVALWESPVPINPLSVTEALARQDMFTVRRRIRSSAADEIARFAIEHRRRFGYELPHIAADAEVQRYEPPIEYGRLRLQARPHGPRPTRRRSIGQWAEVAEAS